MGPTAGTLQPNDWSALSWYEKETYLPGHPSSPPTAPWPQRRDAGASPTDPRPSPLRSGNGRCTGTSMPERQRSGGPPRPLVYPLPAGVRFDRRKPGAGGCGRGGEGGPIECQRHPSIKMGEYPQRHTCCEHACRPCKRRGNQPGDTSARRRGFPGARCTGNKKPEHPANGSPKTPTCRRRGGREEQKGH